MFFNDIYTWSDKKLKRMWIIFSALYYIFATGVPVLCICINYKIFEQRVTGLTGFGLILAVVIVTVFVKNLLATIADMDEIDIKDQRKKFTIQLIIALILPTTGYFILWLLDRNWDTAINTLMWCLGSWCVTIVIYYTCCRSIDVARRIRKKAKEQIAINKSVESYKGK